MGKVERGDTNVPYRISEQDYVDGMRLFCKASPLVVAIRWAAVLGLATICFTGAGCFTGTGTMKRLAAGTSIGGVVVACFMRHVVPFIHRRHGFYGVSLRNAAASSEWPFMSR